MTESLISKNFEQYQEKILDGFSALVAIIDADGGILTTNESWKTFCKEHPDFFGACQPGANYFEGCKKKVENGDDYALKTILGIHSVLKGQRERYTISHPVSEGSTQWLKLKVLPLDEQASGLILIYEDNTRNIQQEKQLRESKKRYQRQFENSLDGCMITTTKGHCVDANPMACKLLGYKKEELLELSREEVVVTSHPGFQDALEQREKTGAYRAEFPLKRSDGQQIFVEAASQVYRDEEDEIRSIFNFRDITNRKKAEAELVNEKKFTDSVVNSIPGGFVVLDEDLNLVRWNENIVNALGYSEDELRKSDPRELIHPDDLDSARRFFEQILETGVAQCEFRVINKSGEEIHLLFQGQKLQRDGKTYVIGSGIDITQQKKVEAQNRRQQVMMDQLFENSPIGIAMMNQEREIIRTNRSFTDIFGYSGEESVGQNIDELISCEEARNEAEILTRQGFEGDTFQVDSVRKTKDGSLVPVLIGGVPVEVEDELIALYGMYADISERKKLEEQIQKLFKKEKKARLRAEKAKLRLEDMFQHAPSAICILEGPEHRYSFANRSYQAMIGRENFIGRTAREVVPEAEEQGFIDLIDKVYETGRAHHEFESPILLNKNGTGKPVEIIRNFVYKPLKNDKNEVYGIFVEAIDVTEQVNNRRELSRSLEEKEILIKEIHHRVKNNLALISSMIELQMAESPDPYEAQSLFATKSRVHTIAQIQELIYQNEDLSSIPFDQYLEDVTRYFSARHKDDKKPVEVNLDMEPVYLNINQAIPLGLLINEIVAKVDRASEGKHARSVTLALNTDESSVIFSIVYEGLQTKESLTFSENKSLNDTLIKTLAQQLNASLECRQTGNNDKTISLRFSHFNKKQGAASMLN